MAQAHVDPEPAPVPPSERVVELAGGLRVLIARLKRRLREEADPGDYTPSQLSVLSLLEREGPATVTTLARAEGVRPQSMGATVSGLQAAGLVSGVPDPNDGRQTLLSLTAEARATFEAGRAARADWLLRTVAAKFTPAEQEQLVDALQLLKRLLEP